jgi:isoleucyl-tRNA synthetase
MDAAGLRARALEEIRKVRWIPPWGEERMANMVAARPDWCISRQRTWGVPIPAFECRSCGEALASEAITLHVADIFGREGSNAWFLRKAGELLPAGTKCPKCGSTDLDKENNILDVWFESGASHSILGKRPDLPWPADVYIEGTDQYRGWFNSSLLVGAGARNGSPYKACITHGFVLDEQGRAMSKSLGNVIDPDSIISKNGAEILRLWVAMLNFKEDTRLGDEVLGRLVDAYRKLRNTWRFLLGNLYDFAPDTDTVAKDDLLDLDRWALDRTAEAGRRILKAYEDYEYHAVFHTVYNLFTIDLSAVYLDVLKDRLYCSAKGSRLRRSAQTALFRILRETLELMAPVLPFTAEEAWESLPAFAGKETSVHLRRFPACEDSWLGPDARAEMDRLLALRETVLKALESAREEKRIGNSLEAEVRLKLPPAERELAEKRRGELAALFIVSSVVVEPGAGSEVEVSVGRAPGKKCERCWNYSDHVGTSAAHPGFCRRCEDVVEGRAR